MHHITQLIRDHEALDEMASALIELTEAPEPLPIEAFTALRHIGQSVDNHMLAERDFLTPDPDREFTEKLGQEIRSFRTEFRDLDAEWPTYLQEWSIENIGLDWTNFGQATQWIMARFRARIARENDLLYPLALHYGHIRLREPQGTEAARNRGGGAPA